MDRHVLQKAGIELSIAEPRDANDSTQTLFCLHGIGGDDKSFLPQLNGLSAHHRVVAWNMPGYGQSKRLHNVSFKNLSLALKNVLNELEISLPILVGQSIGGMIAQEFEHQFPGQAKALVLIATTSAFGGGDDQFKNDFLKARLKPLDDGMSMASMTEGAIPKIVAENADPSVIKAAVASMSAVNPAVYKEVLSCLITFERRKEWLKVACPVCLIAGEEDTNAPAKTMQKMSAKLAHSEYHAITEAGHLVNLERGDDTNAIITQFINRIVRNDRKTISGE